MCEEVGSVFSQHTLDAPTYIHMSAVYVQSRLYMYEKVISGGLHSVVVDTHTHNSSSYYSTIDVSSHRVCVSDIAEKS